MTKGKKDRKGRALNKGEYQFPNSGLYRYRYRFNTKEKYTCVYAKTLSELREKEDKINRLKYQGVNLSKGNPTLNDVYFAWKSTRVGIKKTTFQNYIYMYEKFVMEGFGQRKLRDLVKSDYKRFYNMLHSEKGIKISTIDSIHTVVHQVVGYAVDDEYLQYNPSDNAMKDLYRQEAIEKEQSDTEKVTGWNEEESDAYFSFLQKSTEYKYLYPIFKLLYETGMRVGEFGALQEESIDYENKLIMIRKNLVSYTVTEDGKNKTVYAMHPPKTAKSKRDIPVREDTLDVIRLAMVYKKAAGQKCLRPVDGYKNFLFLTTKGNPYMDTTLNKSLKKTIMVCNEELTKNGKTLQIPIISVHKFRHMFNTRLAKQGIMEEVRMVILGHSDPEVNIGTYTHIDVETARGAIEKLKY